MARKKVQVTKRRKSQAHTEANSEVLITCSQCHQRIPQKQLFKHMWDEHHDHMVEVSKKGQQARYSPKEEPSKRKPTQKMETVLPGGESVEGYEEKPGERPPEEPPAADKTPKTEKKPEEGFIEGEEHWVKARVSIKTLAYFEYTASEVRRNGGAGLTLGDFFDICVDDYFKGRNMSLGLVRLGEKKEGS